jgi:hypothetical protein
MSGSERLCSNCAIKPALDRIKSGKRLFLYQSVYVPVDSEINGESTAPAFDIGQVESYGQLGWDVVACVPKTMGIALYNRSLGTDLQTFGAGIGGNVVGVHFVLRKELKEPLTDDDIDELKSSVLKSASST